MYGFYYINLMCLREVIVYLFFFSGLGFYAFSAKDYVNGYFCSHITLLSGSSVSEAFPPSLELIYLFICLFKKQSCHCVVSVHQHQERVFRAPHKKLTINIETECRFEGRQFMCIRFA